MLLFIDIVFAIAAGEDIFQNISCYCLSLLAAQINHRSEDFKTSHVIVYPLRRYNFLHSKEFQNISCYCLSEYTLDPEESARIFQNISCYCLSSSQCVLKPYKAISKHLMLLFIGGNKGRVFRKNSIPKHFMLLFIIFQGAFLFHEFHFKTSHVIVYPISQG